MNDYHQKPGRRGRTLSTFSLVVIGSLMLIGAVLSATLVGKAKVEFKDSKTSAQTQGKAALNYLQALSSSSLPMTFAPDNALPNKVYVTANGSDNVFVIDGATNTVIAEVPAGHGPHGIAITPNGARAYVANVSSNSVTVIDTTTDTVVATVPVGFTPAGVAITPDGSRVYVANIGSHSVSVIETATNTVVTTVPTGTEAFQIAITPDGADAYVAPYQQTYTEPLTVIATATNTVSSVIPVSVDAIAITPDGTRAYGTTLNGTAIVIDTATQNVIATIPFGSRSLWVAITPDGSLALASDQNGNKISVINTSTNSVAADIPVVQLPNGLAIAPDGTRAYVANNGPNANNVSVVDLTTNTVIANVPLGTGSGPLDVAIKTGGSQPASAACDGQNYNSDSVLPSNTCTGGPLEAFTWFPAATETISRVEIFTGFPSGETRLPNRLAIWSDDGGSPSKPLAALSSTDPFNVVSTNSWQGANLTTPITVTAGQKYWVVWDPDVSQTCSSSADPAGTHLAYWASSSGTVDGEASWLGPFGQPYNNQVVDRWKFRMYCEPQCPSSLGINGHVPDACEGNLVDINLALTGQNFSRASVHWSLDGPSPNPNLADGTSFSTTLGNLTAGDYTITATVTQSGCADNSTSLHFTVGPVGIANAGPDQVVCETTSTQLAANAPSVGIGTWTVSDGPAQILEPSNPTTMVTNLGYGDTVFHWTITNGECSTTDTIVVTRHETPTTPDAGPDQHFCEDSTATLTGNTITVGFAGWELVSGGGPTVIADPHSPTTTVSGLGYGENIFQWRVSNGSCGVLFDRMTITRYETPTTASAGVNQSFCETSTATLQGNTPTVGVGTWTLVSGSGTITDPSNPTTTVMNLGYGENKFRWKIDNGSCAASADTVKITRYQTPTTSNAGPNQTICDSSATTMAANTPTVGTGTWILVSGSGTIVEPNNPTTQITNLGYGANVFRWKIDDGSCAASTSKVTITRNACAGNVTALGPAKVWFGVKSNADVGMKIDLRAEVFKNGTLIGSGQLDAVSGGSIIFNEAVARLVSLSVPAPVAFSSGDIVSIMLSARISSVPGVKGTHTVRLWYNDPQADTHFEMALEGQTRSYYFVDSSLLSFTPGTGPRVTLDIVVQANKTNFVPFGTWNLRF